MSTLLEVDDLHVEFHLRGGSLRAVDGVSFDLRVGESGCGAWARAAVASPPPAERC